MGHIDPKKKEKAGRFLELVNKINQFKNDAAPIDASAIVPVSDKEAQVNDFLSKNSLSLDELDVLIDTAEFISSAVPFIPKSPMEVKPEELAEMDKIPFKEMLEYAFQHLADDPQAVKMMFDVGSAVSKWINRPRRKLSSLMKLITDRKVPAITKFEQDIVSRFLAALESAERKDYRGTVQLIKIVIQKRLDMMGARTWWDSSRYRRLGMEQENPTLRQVFEAIFKKDEMLFNLPESEIINIVVRLCKDFASAIEEHLKFILATIVNLNRVKQKKKFVPFDYELGFYTHEIKPSRTWDQLDFLDFRNIATHSVPKITLIDKAKEDLEITFTLTGHDQLGNELPPRPYPYSWKSFLAEFKRFMSLTSLFDLYFEAWDAEIERGGKEPDGEATRRLERIKNDPVLARNFMKVYGRLLQYSIKPPETPIQEIDLWLARAALDQIIEDYQSAEFDFQQALAVKSDSLVPLINFGVYYLQPSTRNLIKARDYLERARMMAPDDASALYNLACLNSLEKQVDVAISFLRDAIGKEAKYKAMATTDTDFENIRHDPRFQSLIT